MCSSYVAPWYLVPLLMLLADHSGLTHEISSPAQTLGSWFRNLLEAWVYICAFLCLCLVWALRRADPPSKDTYQL
jgi:hypothetical protein